MASKAEPTTTKGFKARCPICGESDTLRIAVEDVHTMRCAQCDSDVTAEDIREVIAQWARFLAWLDSAPVYED